MGNPLIKVTLYETTTEINIPLEVGGAVECNSSNPHNVIVYEDSKEVYIEDSGEQVKKDEENKKGGWISHYKKTIISPEFVRLNTKIFKRL
jgi:diaminopimelate epimerase